MEIMLAIIIVLLCILTLFAWSLVRDIGTIATYLNSVRKATEYKVWGKVDHSI